MGRPVLNPFKTTLARQPILKPWHDALANRAYIPDALRIPCEWCIHAGSFVFQF